MDILLKEISKYPNGTELFVKWKNGDIVYGSIDTIYETDNGLELEDKKYKEFYACLLYVLDILGVADENKGFVKGDFIEISMQNPPQEISLKDETIIWEQK